MTNPSAKHFARESDLCQAFISGLKKQSEIYSGPKWVVYPETGGFDILLSDPFTGTQVGIQAKLLLNIKVLLQSFPDLAMSGRRDGPDYRAVLVPKKDCQNGLEKLAPRLGLTVIEMSPSGFYPNLPDGSGFNEIENWMPCYPEKRIQLPDYVPDCGAGNPSPLMLTAWKIKAIKLAIILENRPVNRQDFRELQLSDQRWLDPVDGWLYAVPEGFIARSNLPDFKSVHPVNYSQIKADISKWLTWQVKEFIVPFAKPICQ